MAKCAGVQKEMQNAEKQGKVKVCKNKMAGSLPMCVCVQVKCKMQMARCVCKCKVEENVLVGR